MFTNRLFIKIFVFFLLFFLSFPHFFQKASAEIPGQIKVQSNNPSWLVRSDGSPLFMCGAGDPEDFLFLNNQSALIEKMQKTGANSIYMIAVRSHGGDGMSTHNPFINNSPLSGLDQNKLSKWDQLIGQMETAGIIAYFFFYDDSSCPWGDCTGGVGNSEKQYIEGIVNKFEKRKNIIWIVAEEYGERFSKNHVSQVAKIIKDADDHDHPVGVHQNDGLDFDFKDDPNIDHFAIQYNVSDPKKLNSGMNQAWKDSGNKYNLTHSEAAEGIFGTGDAARRSIWAVAMGGAYVTVHGWDIANTPEARLKECGYMVKFFESSKINTMAPNNDLKTANTQYVLSNNNKSYIAYTSSGNTLGIKNLPQGSYNLKWLDTISGKTQTQNYSHEKGDGLWNIPSGFSSEVALSIEQAATKAPATVTPTIFVCLGSCPSSPTSTTKPTPKINQAINILTPKNNQAPKSTSNKTPSPSIKPDSTGNNQNWLTQFLELLLQLLNAILNLFKS